MCVLPLNNKIIRVGIHTWNVVVYIIDEALVKATTRSSVTISYNYNREKPKWDLISRHETSWTLAAQYRGRNHSRRHKYLRPIGKPCRHFHRCASSSITVARRAFSCRRPHEPRSAFEYINIVDCELIADDMKIAAPVLLVCFFSRHKTMSQNCLEGPFNFRVELKLHLCWLGDVSLNFSF